MDSIKENLEFESLCQKLFLGELVNVPTPLSGGLLHRMYAIRTTKGKYAIKLLNSQIMLRPTAIQNYIDSEKIASFVSKKISALPAKNINSNVLQKIDNQFYLVFDWIKGKNLKTNEINTVHCEKIGAILAEIHKIDFSPLGIFNDKVNNGQTTNWNYYLQKGKEERSTWVRLLLENFDNLNSWNSAALAASNLLSTNMVISHRDLDPKNVMWVQYKPLLIDWESAGYINPMQDLIETAIYWSKNENGNVDEQKFFSFINGYKKNYGELHANWKMVLVNGFLSRLEWLEYNLKRSLLIECTDEEEQQLGTIQVIETINEMKLYADTIPKLLDWLHNEL